MTCTPFRTADGTTGFICTRGRKPKAKPCRVPGCSSNGHFLCDAPVGDGTCDTLVCAVHRNRDGERDLCPRCAGRSAVDIARDWKNAVAPGDGAATTHTENTAMSKWDQYSKRAKETGGGGLFARLTSGQSIKFIVIGDPHEAHKLFPEDGGKPQDVEPGTAGATVQIMLHVYDTDQKSGRILQITPRTFVDLADKLGEFGDDHIFRLKRTGEGMKTRYAVDHISNASEQQLQLARGQDPIDIEQYGGRPIELEPDAEPTKPATKPAAKPSTATQSKGGRPAAMPADDMRTGDPNDDEVPF